MATRWSLCNVSLSANHRRLPVNCSIIGHSARCGAAIRSLSKRRSSACSSCCAPRRTNESSYAGVRVVSRCFASLESPYQQRIIDGRSIDSIESEASQEVTSALDVKSVGRCSCSVLLQDANAASLQARRSPGEQRPANWLQLLQPQTSGIREMKQINCHI